MTIRETVLSGDVQGTLLTPEAPADLGVIVLAGSSGRVDVTRASAPFSSSTHGPDIACCCPEKPRRDHPSTLMAATTMPTANLERPAGTRS